MTKRDLETAVAEAARFLSRAKDVKETWEPSIHGVYPASQESAACKRASLDLTRALSQLRKPS